MQHWRSLWGAITTMATINSTMSPRVSISSDMDPRLPTLDGHTPTVQFHTNTRHWERRAMTKRLNFCHICSTSSQHSSFFQYNHHLPTRNIITCNIWNNSIVSSCNHWVELHMLMFACKRFKYMISTNWKTMQTMTAKHAKSTDYNVV